MLCPQSIEAVRNTFRQRLLADHFDLDTTLAGPCYPSVKAFIAAFADGGAWTSPYIPDHHVEFKPLTNLAMTMREFLDREGDDDRPTHPPTRLGAVVTVEFCHRHLRPLLERAYARQWAESAQALLAEVDASGPADWCDRMCEEPVISALTSDLATDFLDVLGERTLASFYKRVPAPGAFFESADPAVKPATTGDCVRIVLDADANADADDDAAEAIDLQLHAHEGARDNATCYEWTARLCGAGDVVHSVMRGVVFAFARDRDADREATIAVQRIAAPTVEDAAILAQLLTQHSHGGVNAMLERGDLCFVSRWERHPDAEKGAGARGLRAAAQILRRRFGALRTMVFDARPRQFDDWSSERSEPAAITAEREAAAAALRAHIERSRPEGYDIVTVLCDQRCAGVPKLHPPEHDRLGHIFHTAGMPYMQQRVALDRAPPVEIAQALRYLLLDHGIQYVPLRAADEWIGAHLNASNVLEPETLEGTALHSAFTDFVEDLPSHVRLAGTYLVENMEMDAEAGMLVFKVETTVSGEPVTGYFTAVGKPRPLRAEWVAAQL